MSISPKTLRTITNEASYHVLSEICTTIRLMVEDAGMDDYAWERGYRYARKIKMTWTAEPPTEPGWYWVRWPDNGPRDYCEPTIEDVYEDLNGLYVAGVPLPDCPLALWWPTPIPAPPIHPPIEGEY
jgi:hypothetical protein